MGLRLLPVRPRQGWQWVILGLKLWAGRPVAFTGLLALFLMVFTLVLIVVPVFGGMVAMCAMPLLSLGFLVASRSAVLGGPVHALQLAEGLKHPRRSQLRAQLILCLAYGVTTMMVLTLADWVDGGQFEALQRVMAKSGEAGKVDPQLAVILADPRLGWGMLVRMGLSSLLSIPFWHAPPLVHWGGQSAMQALFSSTLAMWRTRGAFALYMLGWALVTLGVMLLLTTLATLLGQPRLVVGLAMPVALPMVAAFYVSLWFSFVDTFGTPDAV